MGETLDTISNCQFPIGALLFLFCVTSRHDFPGRSMLTRSALWTFCSAAALVQLGSLEGRGVYWQAYAGTRWVYNAWFFGSLIGTGMFFVFVWRCLAGGRKGSHPDRLPDRLHDPLQAASPLWIFFLCAFLARLATIDAETGGTFSATLQTRSPRSALWLLAIALGTGVVVSLRFLFAHKPTDALLLRQFGADSRSYALQKSIRRAIGSDFRLSGIREPRRRVSMIGRAAFMIHMVFRYALTRFMNLEAGPDWRARLWRSLADTRVVFLDVRTLSQSVVFEARLAYLCAGLSRICFIGDSGYGSDEWVDRIRQVLDTERPPSENISLAIWDPSRSADFEQEVKTFLSQSPARPPGLVMEAYGMISEWVPSRKQFARELGVDFLTALVGLGLLVLVSRF